ncbi:MAG: hypothetical protein CMN55_02590 [Sneathiella sp.]|jgi:hypothetical protein|uniref:beta-ketoacyl synthase chain length factor n=1 Tax=Sneathiella sp. TaxID=1964365 RepID=UPI000C5CE694|nr:beta-ketoacyl synthase chain length factor [Sneathiella sp.]MAL77994.1 hypothetical protein [Sneathiella sp.]
MGEVALSFSLQRWSAWAPGLYDPDAWRQWAEGEAGLPTGQGEMPDVRDLPAGLRRRLSRLGKLALRTAMDIDPGLSPRLVFSSRNGNVTQMLGLLESLAREEPLSPTGFGMSVHNSLAGMLSIISKNRETHTAIAAGGESFCLGLIEALTTLQEDPSSPVLFLHADEPLPEFYEPYGDAEVPLAALALLIAPADEAAGEMYRFGFTGAVGREHGGDPLTSFLRFMLRGQGEWRWSGEQGDWWCRRHV